MLSANLSALPHLPVEGTCSPHLLTFMLPPDCSTHHLRKIMADLPSELIHGSPSLEAPSTLDTVSCSSVFIVHRTDSPGRHRAIGEGRDNVYSALHRKSNPVPNSVVSKCLLNETSFWSDCQALYFHRSERKGEETGRRWEESGTS